MRFLSKEDHHAKNTHYLCQFHGICDYLIGLLLVTSPLYMAYPAKDAQIIAFAFGGAVIGYSMMTDYPLAILRFVPFPVHRTLDFLLGAALLLSPIGFEVNGARAVLFVILGLFLIGLAFKTRGQFSPSGQDQPIVPGSHLR